MKLRATKKEIREGYYKIISAGYCDVESLLVAENAFAYSAGSLGWCCDYYDIDGVCISTGYSPLSDKHMKDDYKVVRKYNEKAKKLLGYEPQIDFEVGLNKVHAWLVDNKENIQGNPEF